jgi:thermitase
MIPSTFRTGALVAGIALALLGPAAAQNSQSTSIQFQEIPGLQELTGRLIVRPLQTEALMEQGYSLQQAELMQVSAKERLHGLVREYIGPNDEYVINLPEGMSEGIMASNLLATGEYQYAEPDWMLYPLQTTPNDPQFNSQWWHQNINSEIGWDYYTGDTNYIAGVVDTGVDSNHPDLQANLLSGYNSADRQTEANGGRVEDINGHGTMTMGCVGAIGNNNNQVAGTMWNCGLLPIRCTNSSNGGAYLSDLTDGALWAGQQGAGSVSVSYSGVESSSVGTTGTTLKNSYDCLMVWAAGNSGYQLSSGADWNNVIITSATDSNNNKASWSNYGAPIDVGAPGVSVLTTSNGGGTASVSGTSFSCPITNGVVGLIRSYNPNLSAQEAEDVLFGACQNIGTANNFGHGLVDSGQSLMDAGGGTVYDLTLTMTTALIGGQTASATISGSASGETMYLYNGSGLGTTTIPGLGTLDIASANRVAAKSVNAFGFAVINKFLPTRFSGLTVFIQAIDTAGRTSNIHTETIQ